MSKVWTIFRREYTQVVKKKSFLIGIILTPALMAGFILLPALFARQEADEAEVMAIVDASQMNLGERFSDELGQYTLQGTEEAYYNVESVIRVDSADSERTGEVLDSLRQSVIDGNVKYVVVIGANPHLDDNAAYVITNSENFISLRRFERRLSSLLSSARLEMTEVNLSVDSVLSLTRRIDMQVRNAKGDAIGFEVKWFAALVFVMIMYVMIVAYGQMVMRSVIEEKNSRIMEVLVSSVSPFKLMIGKVLGLGAVTFTQLLIWVALGAVIYIGRGTMAVETTAAEQIIFDPIIITFFVLFMVCGYILYSTVFALLGSVVTNEKEAQGFVLPIVMMLILPVIVGVGIIQEPNSFWAVLISMIPFFAPTMMTMRVIFVVPTVTDYSLFSGIVGEATLSLVFVILATLGMVWLTGRIFRVGVLMYGKRATLPEIVKWIRHR